MLCLGHGEQHLGCLAVTESGGHVVGPYVGEELRGEVEHLITLAKAGTLHARRQALAYVYDSKVVDKLFHELAPRFMERPGGYTRIVRLGVRRGDAALVVQIELV